jgi:hypothetical protein
LPQADFCLHGAKPEIVRKGGRGNDHVKGRESVEDGCGLHSEYPAFLQIAAQLSTSTSLNWSKLS